MIKLIASDIDGTLVPDSSRDIDPEIFRALMELKHRGVKIALASGRQKESIVAAFGPIEENIFYIASNGTYIGTYGRDLVTWTIEEETARQLLTEMKAVDPKIDCLINTVGESYTDSEDPAFHSLMRDNYGYNLKIVPDLYAVIPGAQILTVSFHRDRIPEVAGFMQERWQDRMQVCYSGLVWLDFLKMGANKGRAVRELQESFGILPEETMVFGDQQNDVEMMKRAYYSYAVANAVPAAKEAARFLTDSNVNGGVLKILRAVLDGEIGELPQ